MEVAQAGITFAWLGGELGDGDVAWYMRWIVGLRCQLPVRRGIGRVEG